MKQITYSLFAARTRLDLSCINTLLKPACDEIDLVIIRPITQKTLFMKKISTIATVDQLF